MTQTNSTSKEGNDVQDYEQLRERALRGEVGGWRLGLGVVEHRGVAAWLRVRLVVAVAAPAPAPARAGRPVLAEATEELVAVLAGPQVLPWRPSTARFVARISPWVSSLLLITLANEP